MSGWVDYYVILGVSPDARDQELKRAFRYKSQVCYPDKVRPEHKDLAEKEFKAVKEAYDVLSDPEERRKYDAEWLGRNGKSRPTDSSPPIPQVDPPAIQFKNVSVGKRYSSFFVVHNVGGAYTSIRISNPDTWLKVVAVTSLDDADELPLQVELAAVATSYDRDYVEYITVALDSQDIQVKVDLQISEAEIRKHAEEKREQERQERLRQAHEERRREEEKREQERQERLRQAHEQRRLKERRRKQVIRVVIGIPIVVCLSLLGGLVGSLVFGISAWIFGGSFSEVGDIGAWIGGLGTLLVYIVKFSREIDGM